MAPTPSLARWPLKSTTSCQGWDLASISAASRARSADFRILGDIYAFPLDPEAAIELNIQMKGGDDNATENGTPMHPPWWFPEAAGEACKYGSCSNQGTCRGDSADPDNPLTVNASGDQCGWEDTYYYGFPSYNTWITGKEQWNIIRGYEKIRWFNPKRDQQQAAHEIDYFTRGQAIGASDEWENAAFLAIASSQSFGHTDTDKQPVVERSIGVSGFTYQKPQLISVHLGTNPPSDDVTSALLIWH